MNIYPVYMPSHISHPSPVNTFFQSLKSYSNRINLFLMFTKLLKLLSP